VQVIVVAQDPVKHICFTFHSSKCYSSRGTRRKLTPSPPVYLIPPVFLIEAGVMNFIGAREAVSVFPYSTVILRTFYPCSRTALGSDWMPKWASKYSKRGYRIDRKAVVPRTPTGVRHLTDHHSWIIKFDEGEA
jgi:hypothetical protein